jgi:hypothetical protein
MVASTIHSVSPKGHAEAEKQNKTIKAGARATLLNAGFGPIGWPYAGPYYYAARIIEEDGRIMGGRSFW